MRVGVKACVYLRVCVCLCKSYMCLQSHQATANGEGFCMLSYHPFVLISRRVNVHFFIITAINFIIVFIAILTVINASMIIVIIIIVIIIIVIVIECHDDDADDADDAADDDYDEEEDDA